MNKRTFLKSLVTVPAAIPVALKAAMQAPKPLSMEWDKPQPEGYKFISFSTPQSYDTSLMAWYIKNDKGYWA